MKISNTLTGSKSTVKSVIGEDVVGIYVCGVTPYDSAHVGHAMSLMVYDVLIRYLRWRGYEVNFVSNYTDVDDKLIDRARELAIEPLELADRNIEEWEMEQRALGLLVPDVRPRVTQEIDSIIEMIREIIDHGLAYATSDGDVYYRVRSNSDYGKLSHRRVDDLRSGSGLEMDNTKEDPLDFALWKATKPGEPSWASPWGSGRPGWHIECSAMSNHFISNHFDIHGGGMDLTFPHHENEIAQSEGANDCKFVNTWMHVGFVNIDDEKMSKSLNNFFTIRDVLKTYDGEALRYFLISSHYRSPLNYSETNIESAQSALLRLYNAIKGLNHHSVDPELIEVDYETRFNAALNDDFNTPMALSILFEIAKQINIERTTNPKKASALSSQLVKLGNYIGILNHNADEYLKQGSDLSESEISKKIDQREAARNSKDFAMSDQIRDELLELGIILEDSANGTTWRRK